MKNFTKQLVNDAVSIFQTNLLCVLLLGSVLKNDTTPFSDIDLVFIIRNFDLRQIKKMRNIIKNSTKLIDLSILCHNEISNNPDLFTLGTHGSYQLGLILNKAKCLYGENILLNLKKPSEISIKRSLIQKIAQYTWWIRRMFVESNRERSIETNYQINSRLIKMIKGLLYLEHNIDIHTNTKTAICLFAKKYASLFSNREVNAILNMTDEKQISANSANLSEEYLEIRFSIYNKIYKRAIQFYS